MAWGTSVRRRAGVSRAPRRGLGALAIALAVGACGAPLSSDGRAGLGTAAPSTTAPAPATAAPVRERTLVAILDRPFGSLDNVVRLIDVEGAELARAPVPEGVEALALAGRRVLLAGNGRIDALDADGGPVAEVERIDPSAPDVLIDGLIARPDGRSWLWAAVRNRGDGTLESRLLLGGDSLTPTPVATRVEPSRVTVPVRWTSAGPVVSDEETGIGGYALFRRGFGDAELVDITTHRLIPLSPATCAFSDLADDGTLACVTGGHEAPPGLGPVRLRIGGPRRPVRELPLVGAGQAGAAYFSPDGRTLSLASSPATGAQPERVTTELVDVASGARRPLGVPGLTPVGWTPAGVLVATRSPGVGGGAPGTYVVRANGGVARISGSSTVVGVGG